MQCFLRLMTALSQAILTWCVRHTQKVSGTGRQQRYNKAVDINNSLGFEQ